MSSDPVEPRSGDKISDDRALAGCGCVTQAGTGQAEDCCNVSERSRGRTVKGGGRGRGPEEE